MDSTPRATDTRLTRYKRWLASIQNRAGSLAKNNPSKNDNRRAILVKILRAKKGI